MAQKIVRLRRRKRSYQRALIGLAALASFGFSMVGIAAFYDLEAAAGGLVLIAFLFGLPAAISGFAIRDLNIRIDAELYRQGRTRDDEPS